MHKLAILAAATLLTSCARLDHVQIGDIDQTQGTLTPFTVQVSEFGLEAAAAAGTGAHRYTRPSLSTVSRNTRYARVS